MFFLDFEASGLGPDSYPIEVAWGDMATGEVEAHLIDPSPVPEWDHPMEQTAVMVHGLTWDLLAEHGDHPGRVASRMNEALAGATVYADSQYDRQWLGELFRRSGVTPACGLIAADQLWDELLAGVPGERIEQADAEAWKRLNKQGVFPHRAANDVRHMLEVRRILRGG